MPIRPENRDRYPADWPAIRDAIVQRAAGQCECRGECGRPHLGRCPERDRTPSVNGRPGKMIYLTVAHLDHVPEHSGPDNLRAWCPGCHLRYDVEHHLETRRARAHRERREAGQLTLAAGGGVWKVGCRTTPRPLPARFAMSDEQHILFPDPDPSSPRCANCGTVAPADAFVALVRVDGGKLVPVPAGPGSWLEPVLRCPACGFDRGVAGAQAGSREARRSRRARFHSSRQSKEMEARRDELILFLITEPVAWHKAAAARLRAMRSAGDA